MSDDFSVALVVVLVEVIPAVVFLYAAYWAFTIRRALVSRIYRNQAMWLGGLTTVLAVALFATYSSNPVVADLINVYIALVLVVTFAYVDSAIPVIRRSDPLLRKILNWGTLRYFLWFDAAVLASFNIAPGLFPSLASGLAGFLVQDLGWFVTATILFGVSGVGLFIGARRSMDMVLRSSLKWLGVTLLVTVALFVADTTETAVFPNITQFQFYYSYYALPFGVFYVAMAYCIYRSVRALAPIGKIQNET